MKSIEKARILGRRVFYERETDTLRSYPENYCLAIRTKDRKWNVYRDEGATKLLHDRIETTLNEWQEGSTSDKIINEISKLFMEV